MIRRIALLTAATLALLATVAAGAAQARPPVEVRKEPSCSGHTYNVYVDGQPLFVHPQIQCPPDPA